MADVEKDRPGGVEVHVGPVGRLGRRGADRITSTAREPVDLRLTPGYEREVLEIELKRVDVMYICAYIKVEQS